MPLLTYHFWYLNIPFAIKKSSTSQGTMRTISSYICWLQGKFKVGVVSKKSCRTILVRICLMPFIWLSGNGPSLLGLVSRVLFLYRKGSFLVAGIETVHEPTVFKQHSFMILPFWRSRFWPWSHRTKNQGDGETVFILMSLSKILDFPGGSDGKEFACNGGDTGSIPGLGISPGGGHGNPLHYSHLENPHGQRSLDDYSPRGHKRVGHDLGLNTATRRF